MQFTQFLLPPHSFTVILTLHSTGCPLLGPQFITSLGKCMYSSNHTGQKGYKELTRIKERELHFRQIYIFSCDTLTSGLSSLPYELPCATSLRITDFENKINYTCTRSNTTMNLLRYWQNQLRSLWPSSGKRYTKLKKRLINMWCIKMSSCRDPTYINVKIY
jgi:hypothetical protein